MPLADSSGIFRALARACQLGKVEDVRYLLDHQANINGKLPDSGLCKKFYPIANYLIEKRFNF